MQRPPNLYNLFARYWFSQHSKKAGEMDDAYRARMLEEMQTTTGPMSSWERNELRRELVTFFRRKSLWQLFQRVWCMHNARLDSESTFEFQKRAVHAYHDAISDMSVSERKRLYAELAEQLRVAGVHVF